MASDLAAKKLIELMGSPKVDDRVKLAAAKDLLDRANLAGKQTIEVGFAQPTSFEDWVGQAIVDVEVEDDEDEPLTLTATRPDIVDAEVVEDEPHLTPRDRARDGQIAEARRRRPVDQRPQAKLDRIELEALASAGGDGYLPPREAAAKRRRVSTDDPYADRFAEPRRRRTVSPDRYAARKARDEQ